MRLALSLTAMKAATAPATSPTVTTTSVPRRDSPMTYMVNGKQYIVVAVSGVNGAQLVAYAPQ